MWSLRLPYEIQEEFRDQRLDLASFDDTVPDEDLWCDESFSYELRVDYAAWKDRYGR
jgi:hypothetical protein